MGLLTYNSDLFTDADEVTVTAKSSDKSIANVSVLDDQLVISYLSSGNTGCDITLIADDGKGGIETDSFFIRFIEEETGVKSEASNAFAVYPTLVENDVTVTGFTGNMLSIISESGVVVKTIFIADEIAEIDLSGLNAGVYCIVVSFESVQLRSFIIIQ